MAVLTFQGFMRKLLEGGLEYFGLYYGIYRAEVMDNVDPSNQGRLKIRCEAIHGDTTCEQWAWPISGYGTYLGGLWALPDVGDAVYVVFDHGQPDHPLWVGGWWGDKEVSEDMLAKRVALVTPEGMKVVFNREEMTVTLEQSMGNKVFISAEKCVIEHDGEVFINADSAKVLAGGNVEITGNGDVAVQAMGNASLIAAGSCKVDGADKLELSSTSSLRLWCAADLNIAADGPISMLSAKSISLVAPIVSMASEVSISLSAPTFKLSAATMSLQGVGTVIGEWHCAITSATHVHPCTEGGTAVYVPDL